MTAGLMRRASISFIQACGKNSLKAPAFVSVLRQPQRTLANVRHSEIGASEAWFNSSAPYLLSTDPASCHNAPPDDRTIKLGKTIRVLHERLPTLLNSPLPQEILSPHITLHLFPSTHPHLPTVKGRIAYTAALWTAPVAWGRVPVLGNVKLIILSERLVGNGSTSVTSNLRHEKLFVRWKTCGKSNSDEGSATYRGISASEHIDKITEYLRTGSKPKEEFHGMFLFEFDEEGRIAKHTIEHVEEGRSWEQMTKVISVTDWLLGKAWGKKPEEEGTPGLALGYCMNERNRHTRR